MPEANCCHVILATNIAESSITLPRVTIIIDWGQRRHMIYDTRKRLRCLQLDRCSQASLAQRRGEIVLHVALRRGKMMLHVHVGYLDAIKETTRTLMSGLVM